MKTANAFSARPPTTAHPGFGAAPRGRLSTSSLGVLLISLLVGGAAVAWRAHSDADARRARARAEVSARGAALQLQLNRPVHAVDALAAFASQNPTSLPNFQKTAEGLHAAVPELSYLQSEPGGVIGQVVPRQGNGRVSGVNVLADPAHRAAANSALQTQRTHLSLPIRLNNGKPGLLARAPVFHQPREGAKKFWGFVAVSAELAGVLQRAGLNELARSSYGYILLIPGSASSKPVTITAAGMNSLGDTVQQGIRIQNLEMVLAVRPRDGWLNLPRIITESAVVLAGSLLLFILLQTMTSARRMQTTLDETQRRLASEISTREKLYREFESVKTVSGRDLAAANTALEEYKTELARQKNEALAANDKLTAAQAAGDDLETRLQELSVRFDKTVEAHKTELTAIRANLAEAHTALRASEARIEELEGALKTARQEEKLALKTLKEAQAKSQASVAQLENELENEKLSSERASQTAHAKLRETEAINLELRDAAERARRRVNELETLLETSSNRESGSLEASPPEAEFRNSPGEKLSIEEGTAEEFAESETPGESTRPGTGRRTVRPIIFDSVESVESKTRGDLAGALPPATDPEPESLGAAEAVAPEGAATTSARRRGRRKDQDQIELFGTNTNLGPQEQGSFPPVAEEDGFLGGTNETSEPQPVQLDPLANWPDIDGLSRAEGLSRKRGVVKRYLQGLHSFCDEQSRATENIQEALLGGDVKGAARCVRDLEEAAEEIGARKASSAAGKLSQALEAGDDPDNVERWWADLDQTLRGLISDLRAALRATDQDKSSQPRHSHVQVDVDPAQLRRATNEIFPLLADKDPGAKDCLKANRAVFSSAFPSAAFEEFEHLVKRGTFEPALEQLRKAARKHGISI